MLQFETLQNLFRVRNVGKCSMLSQFALPVKRDCTEQVKSDLKDFGIQIKASSSDCFKCPVKKYDLSKKLM